MKKASWWVIVVVLFVLFVFPAGPAQAKKLKEKKAKKSIQEKVKAREKARPLEEVIVSEEVKVPPLSYEEKKEIKQGGSALEAGATYGVFSAASSLLGEIRIPLKQKRGSMTTSLRIAAGLAQSPDSTRRFVPINVDVIFNFPPGHITGVSNYVGGGMNFVALSTGRDKGLIGGQFFYGVESEGMGGVVFGELGYGAMRVESRPSQKGTTVMIGYRKIL